jgi:hypothetical protein
MKKSEEGGKLSQGCFDLLVSQSIDEGIESWVHME